MQFNMNVGDFIGGLYKKTSADGVEQWYLSEGKITKIVQNSRGTKVYSKRFYPLDIEEIEDNTEMMRKANGWILTREVVLLEPDIRDKCERWVKWANENPDKAVSCLGL